MTANSYSSNPADALIRITRIELQQKNKRRYSLFSEDRFVAGVSEDTLLAFNIHPGSMLDEGTIEKISAHERKLALRNQAFRYLSRRAHSRRELHDKLIKKDYGSKEIGVLLDEFVERGYLNDRSYARQFIEDEIHLKKSGPVLIRSKLQQRGIPSGMVTELLDDLYRHEQLIENCRALARKRISENTGVITDKERNRVIRYLRSKGFNWETIEPIMAEIPVEEQE